MHLTRDRVLAALLLATACGEAADQSAVTIDTLPNGVIQVVNQAPRDSASGWKLVPELTIAPGAGAPGELARPTSLAVAPDGRIVVVDGTGAGLLVFDAAGSFDHLIGRRGSGPGEYSWLFDIDISGDTLAISDCNHGRALLYLLNGTLLAQWITHDCAGSSGIRIDSGGVWLGGYLPPDSSGSRSALFRWLPGGTTVDTFVPPPKPNTHAWITPDGIGIPIPFSPFVVSTGSPESWWQGSGSEPLMVKLDGHGDTIRVVKLKIKRTPIPDSIRAAAIAGYLESPRFAGTVHLDDVPRFQPWFSALDLDEDGRIWMTRPGPNGTPAAFKLIDSTGRWLGTIPAPPDLSRGKLLWRNDRMYAIDQTDTGLPVIRVFRVDQSTP